MLFWAILKQVTLRSFFMLFGSRLLVNNWWLSFSFWSVSGTHLLWLEPNKIIFSILAYTLEFGSTNLQVSYFEAWKLSFFEDKINTEGWKSYDKLIDLSRSVNHSLKWSLIYTVAINELLCLENVGAQISMFFTSNAKWIISNHGS